MFHVRAHEFGPQKPRIRIWTDEMSQYGQFNVVSFDDVQALCDLLGKLGIGSVVVHQDDDNTHEPTYGENLKDWIY
jgi:hypothetical protein